MKEDYLWDKTGEDAGIQALENTLKAFRYTETAPPELPAKVFTVEKPKRGRFFQFRFAFAAIVAILSVVWFQIANNKIPSNQSVAAIETPKPDAKIAAENFSSAPGAAAVVKDENFAPKAKSKSIKIRQKSAPVVRAERAILRTTEPKQPAETLTAEEKYAYDQLILALSITGSKLRIVKDKLNGIEEQNAVIETPK
jgi:hypothetical protein